MQAVFKSSLILGSLFVLSQAVAAPPRSAPEPEPLPQYAAPPALDNKSEQRLNLLEKKIDNNVIYDLLEQIAQLKREVSELRGFTEQQGHQMSLLTKRQRSLYQDVDRRMLELEAGSSTSSGMPVIPQNTTDQSSSGLTVPPADSNTSTIDMKGAANTDAVGNEYAEYKKAFNLLNEGNYSQSITAFRAFLTAFGTGNYADNAQYWLGEAYYVTRDYKTALVEFQKILSDYADSPKRNDAVLKIGYTYYELKDWDAAKRALNLVITKYPDTANARTAKLRLERLAREGK